MGKNLTKKQLEVLVEDLRKEIDGLHIVQTQLTEELEAANGMVQEQRDTLAAAQAQVAAAEEV
ncbi:hypothetical protein BC628DRAFT_1423947 [Trametes gibbosa]|nr:hypothetical protein BC628DRAFT_1423947 [Trametes gibbosa]